MYQISMPMGPGKASIFARERSRRKRGKLEALNYLQKNASKEVFRHLLKAGKMEEAGFSDPPRQSS